LKGSLTKPKLADIGAWTKMRFSILSITPAPVNYNRLSVFIDISLRELALQAGGVDAS
jgi:hypothetical protein